MDWQVVNEKQVRDALAYLRSAPKKVAGAVYKERKASETAKRVLGAIASCSKEGSQAAREAEARQSQSYQDAVAELADAESTLAGIKTRIVAEQTVIECWRTQSSNERAAR